MRSVALTRLPALLRVRGCGGRSTPRSAGGGRCRELALCPPGRETHQPLEPRRVQQATRRRPQVLTTLPVLASSVGIRRAWSRPHAPFDRLDHHRERRNRLARTTLHPLL